MVRTQIYLIERQRDELAATSEAENAELKTLNTKHYPMLKVIRPDYKEWKANKKLQRTRSSRAVRC